MSKRYLSFFLLLGLASCTEEPVTAPDCKAITTLIIYSGGTQTRSADPDEQQISDYNIFIFNAFGILEEKKYVSSRQIQLTNGEIRYSTRLLKQVPHTILVAANTGYQLPCRTLEEARAFRYYMAYPDEFSTGIPMAACLEEATADENDRIEIPLQRVMSRLDISIDRTELDKDVTFKVTEVKIGGCPSSVRLWGPSKVENNTQVFRNGYTKSGDQVIPLNQDNSVGISRPVSVYMMENLQGDLLEDVQSDRGKVFSESRYGEVCSYIELKAEYHSPSYHNIPGKRLVYRFYLGENLNNFDVYRNVRYRIYVKPIGDGLSEDSWRVDKSGLEEGDD